MLKFGVSLGVEVKFQRIIKFKQDYFKFKRYCIDVNTAMRATAKTEPLRDTFKLMNNALFDKTCENPVKHIECKILTDKYEILKSVSKPTFKELIRYKDAALIDFYNKEIKYDKPIYLGATVFELSKLHMYDTFYNVLKPSLKDLQLLYIDTDSFTISFTDGNVHDEYMDLSNLDIPIKTNNKVPGNFWYDFGSIIIDELIVSVSKIYSLTCREQSASTKEKGLKKENRAKHEDFYNVLRCNKERTVNENRIQKVRKDIVTVNTT